MYRLIRPLLFTLPAETAHHAGMLAIRTGGPVLPLLGLRFEHPELQRKVFGIRFPNPVGLAAGFDKYALATEKWEQIGFGFCELGTFTRHAQSGNDKPRVWRFPRAQALINRFGFNNAGADAAAERLGELRDAGRWPKSPVGINLGKSKVTPEDAAAEDYLYSLSKLKGFADYITINVSSPNTPGLRNLQAAGKIKKLSAAVVKGAGKVPVLVKFSPDMADKDLLKSCDAALGAGAKGLIVTNTTLSREGLGQGSFPEGGMSGATLTKRADACLALVAKHTKGRVPLIGVGGIMTTEDARRKLELGASLIQIYTGFIYQGPAFPKSICRSLIKSA